MEASARKGNNPELWNSLLEILDEKLQLGLLDKLRRVAAYHLEGDVLYLEPGTPEDEKFLSKEGVLQQITLFSKESLKNKGYSVSEVRLKV